MTTMPTARYVRPLLAGTAAAAIVVIGCGAPGPHRAPESAAPVTAQALAVAAVVSTVGPATFEGGGVVRPQTTAVLAARIMAPVVSVNVRAGDRVTRGATLITLDARELTAQVTRGQAGLLSADASIRAAESQAAAAEASLDLARATHDRIRGLHERKSATAQELDQAVAAFRAAEAQVSASRAHVAAALAARDAARASAEATDIGLSYTVLTSPFDGVVASRSVDPGALATPGLPLLVLEQAGPMRLEASLDEARAGHVAVGHTVEVRFDGDGARWTAATVSEVGRIDPATHSFLVKIDLPPDSARKTGSFGRARFSGEPRPRLTVPTTAVVRRGQLAFVFVVGADHLARLRPITPGPSTGDDTEVLAGLVAGDSIVTAPPAALKDGTPIASTSASAAPSTDGGARGRQ